MHSSPEPSPRVPAVGIQVPEENKHTSTALFPAEGLCKVLLLFLHNFDSTVNERKLHRLLLDEITVVSISLPLGQTFAHESFLLLQ